MFILFHFSLKTAFLCVSCNNTPPVASEPQNICFYVLRHGERFVRLTGNLFFGGSEMK
jgi:hypothetical protein